MANFMQLLIQEAERAKRNLKAAPGRVADQVSNFKEDWKGKDLANAIRSEQLNPEQLKAAIEEVAGNAIPGGAGAAGIFGGAGRQDLVLSRGTDIGSLFSRLINSRNYFKQGPAREKIIENALRAEGRKPTQYTDKDVPYLRSPSMAIHYTNEPNAFDAGVTLIMRPDKFDPANTPRSKLANRDVYTKRSSYEDFLSKEWHGKSAARNPRMTEHTEYDFNSLDEWIQGLVSPEFKSFAEFEASRKGAGTLDAYKNISIPNKVRSREAFERAVIKDLKRNSDNLTVPYEALKDLSNNDFLRELDFYIKRAEAGELGKTSKQVAELAAKMPSGYAELKYSGNVPLDAEHLLGIMLAGRDMNIHKAVAAGFPGIPVMSGRATAGDQYMLDMLAEQIKGGRAVK